LLEKLLSNVIHDANISNPVHIEQFYYKGKKNTSTTCRRKLSIMHTLQIFVYDHQFFPIHLHVFLIYVLPKIQNSNIHFKSHAGKKNIG
jgi:hypothetical protein